MDTRADHDRWAADELSPDAAAARLALFKTLGDNTRYAIYLELARSTRPLTTAEIAETLALHPNTVRPHLDRMREVGLVSVEASARGDVGRPQHRYSLTGDAPSLGLEPPVMPVLARMVLALADRLGGRSDDAFEVGHEEGALRSQRATGSSPSIEALVRDLDRLGFDPVVSHDPADDSSAVVAFANCPFDDLARRHTELVCGLHHGLIAGFADGAGDFEVREFCNLAGRTPCQVSLAGSLAGSP